METSQLIRQVAPDFCVAPQLTPEAMADVAAMGFRSVINNRPDFEEGPHQPTNASVQAAARQAGLEYRYLPVNGAYQSPEEIAQMAALLKELPAPVLAFCRSGARSTKLFLQATRV